MKINLIRSLMLMFLFVCVPLANADDNYFSVSAGAFYQYDISKSESESMSEPSFGKFNRSTDKEFTAKNGLAIAGAWGTKLGSFTRMELEYSFRRAKFSGFSSRAEDRIQDVKRTDFSRYQTADVEDPAGYIQTHALMVNTIFELGNDSPITPFLGFGLGGAAEKMNLKKGVVKDAVITGMDNKRGLPVDYASDVQYKENKKKFVFAYQLVSGISYELSDAWDVTAAYKFFATSGDMRTQNIELGLIYNF